MRAQWKPHLAPLVTVVVLTAGLAWWAVLDLRKLDQFHVAEMRSFADSIFHSFRARYEDLSDEGKQDRKLVARLLDSLVEGAEQVEFAQVRVGPELALSSGRATPFTLGPEPLGEEVTDSAYLFWRPLDHEVSPELFGRHPLGAIGEEHGPGPPPPHLLGPSPTLAHSRPPHAPSLVLLMGLRKERPEPVRTQELTRLGVRFGAAFLAVLALAMAWMLGIRSRLLVARLRLEQSRRAHLEELSLVAAGLAHETKNPLGVIRGLAQRLSEKGPQDPTCCEAAEQIIDAADQAAGRLGEFISYARIRRPRLGPVHAPRLVGRAVAILQADFDHAGVRLEQVTDDIWCRADEEMVLQVLLNLLLNSLAACRAGKRVEVRLAATEKDARLVIADDGAGISRALLPDVFKPYVTGRDGGHGMGLAIVRRIVEQHQWSIELESSPERGTRITIRGIQLTHPGEGA